MHYYRTGTWGTYTSTATQHGVCRGSGWTQAQTDAEGCTTAVVPNVASTNTDTRYTPIDNVAGPSSNRARTVMTVDECRARCAGITNCAYWSRWNDGGCHLSASSTVHGASSVHSGPDAVQSAAGGITSGTQVFIKGFYIKLKLIFIFIFIYISVCSSVYIHQSILSLLSMQKWFGAELTLSYLTPGITSGTQSTNLHQHVCTSCRHNRSY